MRTPQKAPTPVNCISWKASDRWDPGRIEGLPKNQKKTYFAAFPLHVKPGKFGSCNRTVILVGGSKYFFIFTPIPGEMIPFDLGIFFQMGWFNHQLLTNLGMCFFKGLSCLKVHLTLVWMVWHPAWQRPTKTRIHIGPPFDTLIRHVFFLGVVPDEGNSGGQTARSPPQSTI